MEALEINAGWHSQSHSAGLWSQRPLLSRNGLPIALQEPAGGSRRPIAADCDERFFIQTLDHFRYPLGDDSHTFRQRYFICSEYWDSAGKLESNNSDSEGVSTPGRGGEGARQGAKGPIFFYAGNEADVTLYLSSTGLMWENAPDFRALLVFAEHRFYGESLPFGAPDRGREFLSTSQALADYASLISSLRRELDAEATPLIAFGGSYGGMLAAWIRLKYPHLVHGAVAASAPVLALDGLHRPTPDPESFAETVTRAAGPAGGATEECSGNVRWAFAAILSGVNPDPATAASAGAGAGGAGAGAAADDDDAAVGEVESRLLRDVEKSRGERSLAASKTAFSDGILDVDVRRSDKEARDETVQAEKKDKETTETAIDRVARLLRVCPGHAPEGDDALLELAWWARSAFDYLAMGNYPYPTGYILNSGEGSGVELPAWPLREACSRLSDLPDVQHVENDDGNDEEILLSALADAIGVYYNATGDLECFSPNAGANNASAIDAENWNWQACTEMSMPMSTDGERDMFWLDPWDPEAQAAQCLEQFGVSPREGWAAADYGGYDTWSQVTNVVFSNGRLDPWSGMGVVDAEQVGQGVHVIIIDLAAHHLDLFFQDPLDPQEVSQARQLEMDLVEKWVREAYLADGDDRDRASRREIADDSDGAPLSPSGETSRASSRASSPWVSRLPGLAADW